MKYGEFQNTRKFTLALIIYTYMLFTTELITYELILNILLLPRPI